MALLTNQNYVSIPPAVIRVKLSFHSNNKIALPGDTWHLLEFSKTPLVTDLVEQIKFRFELSKKYFVSLELKDAKIFEREKSQIFKDEDTIAVHLTIHKRPFDLGQITNKKVKQSQPINVNSVKRKTAVVVPPSGLRNQPIKTPYSDKQTVDSDSSSTSESDRENSTKAKSVQFIPRQVPGAKTSTNQTAANPVPSQLSSKISDSSSSSSSSSEVDSVDLQSVLRGAKHVRFSKQPKQPIRLRPRGRGRAFGRVPPELADQIRFAPPVGRGNIVTADTDILTTVNHIMTNKQETTNYSHLPLLTLENPPKMNDIIIFKIIELSSEYSPTQSDFRTATVLSYDPSNLNVRLEYVKNTIRDMQNTFSEKNEGKFGMEETENCVQSVEILSLNQLIDPRILE